MAIKNPYNYSALKGSIKLNKDLNNNRPVSSYNNTNTNKFDQYKEQKILTAKPEKLTLMLYEGIIKFLKQAKIFMKQKNIEKTHTAMVRAQDIITELNVTLNMDYEVSKGLASLYDFMTNRLVEANISKDTNMINEVLEIAEGMRDTWKEAMELAAKGQVATSEEK